MSFLWVSRLMTERLQRSRNKKYTMATMMTDQPNSPTNQFLVNLKCKVDWAGL